MNMSPNEVKRILGRWACLVASFLFWASMCVNFAGVAHAQGQVDRPFRGGFGVVTKFSQGQPESQIDLLPQLGVSWVRDTVMWPVVEPRPGEYRPFPLPFQERLKKYKKQGVGVVFMLAYANAVAYPKTPSNHLAPIDPKAFGRYASYVAQQLSKLGVQFALEVWNEPHNFQIREMVGGEWHGRAPSPWVDHYVEMVREVYEQVRPAFPDVPIMTSEDVWSAHYWFARHPRLPKGFRDIGLHPYANDTSSGPEVAAPYANVDWGKPYQLVDADRSFESALRRLRQHTKAQTSILPDVWLTEWGWRIGSKYAGGVITESLAAAFLVRSFVAGEAAGAKVTFWFSMSDVTDGPYGLIDNSGHPRAAFRAFVQMNQLIGDHHYAGRMTLAERSTLGVQAHKFVKGQVQKIVVWSADNTEHQLLLDPAWQVRQVQNLYGQPVTLKNADNAQRLEVGPEPVYLILGTESPSARWSEKLVE